MKKKIGDSFGDIVPWERQPEESSHVYEVFTKYRDMGSKRSLKRVQEESGKGNGYCSTLWRWSRDNNWVARAEAYDDHLDALTRQAKEQATQKEAYTAAKEHARISEKVIKKGLEALEVLNPSDLSASELLNYIKVGIQLQREALGMASKNEVTQTMSLEVTSKLSDEVARLSEELVKRG